MFCYNQIGKSVVCAIKRIDKTNRDTDKKQLLERDKNG